MSAKTAAQKAAEAKAKQGQAQAAPKADSPAEVKPKTPEEKAAKFKEIATRRTKQLVKGLHNLANLSNKAAYNYTPEQVAKIFASIKTALSTAEEKFNQKDKDKSKGQDFSL